MKSSEKSTKTSVAVIDELGNTVGMLVTSTQSCSKQQCTNKSPTMRHSVPCSKQTSITTQWLKENFVENAFTSVARSVMFEEYINYCCDKNTKPFNQAVFGKVVRACFPNLSTRRLGVRGQSRYHYAGLSVKSTSIYAEQLQYNSEKFSLSRFNSGQRSHEHGICDSASHVNAHQPIDKSCKSKYRYGVTKTVLPPYPTENDIILYPFWNREQLGLFLSFYRSYNKHMLNCLITLNFEKTFSHVCNFSNFVPKQCCQLLQSPRICNILAVFDDIMYQEISAFLIPDCLATLKPEFSVTVRKLAKALPTWISEESNQRLIALKEVVHSRVQSAKLWGNHVRRVTTLCHVTKEARKTLTYPSIVNPLLNDLNSISIRDIAEQCSFAGSYVTDDDISEREYAQRYMRRFCDLLRDRVSVEFYAHELERLVEKHAGLKDNSSGGMINDQTRNFVMKWATYGSKILTEITLRSSESVGPFHLVMLLFGDYVNHVITLKTEHVERMKRLRSIICPDSNYFSEKKTNNHAAADVASQSLSVLVDPSVCQLSTGLKRSNSQPFLANLLTSDIFHEDGPTKKSKLVSQVSGVVASLDHKQNNSLAFPQSFCNVTAGSSYRIFPTPQLTTNFFLK